MRDEHLELLDAAPLNHLSEPQLSRIREHLEGCSDCRRAYRAARISAGLLQGRAAVSTEPSPFFQARVMSMIKERANPAEPFSLLRMWKSAGLLVYSMAALVLILTVLTISSPASKSPDVARGLTGDTQAELAGWAVFETDLSASGEMSNGQVLTDIYDPDGERETTNGVRQ
ncbi:MAG TPA: zf-HC2 domain-containing protein [Blastocatellia bacterium]|nr:zf-HC2 domain-containing protein [Blastocatellia bacterium]